MVKRGHCITKDLFPISYLIKLKMKANVLKCTLAFSFYVFSFFIPKIIRNMPLKNLGLLKITTFIISLQSHFAQKPKTITQIARTATRKRVGQKQLTRSPSAKVIPTMPLFEHFFLICLTLRYYIISNLRQYVTKVIKIYLKLLKSVV